MTWEVYRNGRSLGIIESHFVWACAYWRGRFTDEVRHELVPRCQLDSGKEYRCDRRPCILCHGPR